MSYLLNYRLFIELLLLYLIIGHCRLAPTLTPILATHWLHIGSTLAPHWLHIGSTLAPHWLHIFQKGGRQHFLLFLNITLRFRFRCISMQPCESIVVYWLMIPRLELCHGGSTYHTTISSAEDSMERTRRLYRHIYLHPYIEVIH